MPTSSRVSAGLRSSKAIPLDASTHSPLMKFLKTVGRTAVAIEPLRALSQALRYGVFANLVSADRRSKPCTGANSRKFESSKRARERQTGRDLGSGSV